MVYNTMENKINDVIKINSAVINDFISRYIPIKDILSQDLVIAGGFPLFLLKTILSYNENFAVNHLENYLNCKNYRRNDSEFSDIDIWRLESIDPSNSINEIFDKAIKHNGPSLLVKDIDSWCSNSEGYITSISKWATTLDTRTRNYNGKSVPLQFVKAKKSSPEDLILSFDIERCMVAWSKGIIYASRRAIESINKLSLSFNSDYIQCKETIGSKVYRSKRYIKYISKHNLIATEDVCNYIFNTLVEVISPEVHQITSDEKIDELYKKREMSMKLEVSIPDYYTSLINKIHFIKSFINMEIPILLSKQKNFKKEKLLFILDNPKVSSSIKKIVEEGLDNTNRGLNYNGISPLYTFV
jgi:hypothetical protein